MFAIIKGWSSLANTIPSASRDAQGSPRGQGPEFTKRELGDFSAEKRFPAPSPGGDREGICQSLQRATGGSSTGRLGRFGAHRRSRITPDDSPESPFSEVPRRYGSDLLPYGEIVRIGRWEGTSNFWLALRLKSRLFKKIDAIVVYKVDRLSRSLLDFSRIMEALDAHECSFVSVTQQFNTTHSMGRLTLNILLSFAQFEREIIAERTKDKMAASRKKGKWVGGGLILGYDLDRLVHLVVERVTYNAEKSTVAITLRPTGIATLESHD